MPDLGLDQAYGAQGGADALQQIFERRMQQAASDRAQKALEQQDALTRLKIQEHADEVRQNLEGRRQAEKDRTEAAKASNEIRLDQVASNAFTMNPAGSELAPPLAQRAQSLGFPVSRIAGPKVQQTSGFMPLPSASSQGPGMQQVEGLTPINGPQAPAGQASTTTDTQSPMNAPDTFQRGATQADIVKQKADALAAAKPDAAVEAARVAAENRQENIRLMAALKPAPAEHLQKVEHKGADGRTVIEYLPSSEVRGKTFEKGASGITENRLASAEAVSQTGADIIAKLSNPDFVKVVGPAMGRSSTLRDFIGNPPPEFSELAGTIESYALANMGVHGMRSSQGAEQIKKLLDQHHTPESLVAAIKGLSHFSEHFMQNEGRGGGAAAALVASGGGSAAPAAPAGWKYVAKPGGGWTAVKATP